MGVSMIGKQRRTPGVLSPREVFFCSPPPSPSYMAPLQNHHHYLPHTTLASTTPGPVTHPPSSVSSRVGVAEASSGRSVHLKHSIVGASVPNSSNSSYVGLNSSLQSNNSSSAGASAAKGPSETSSATAVSEYIGPDGKPLQVLPHYPDMEYPPIFEAGSYSIADSVASATCTPLQSAQPPTSQGCYGHGYTPSYQSRTPTHLPRTPTHAQYYNLQGFNSSSLPALPVQEPDYNRAAGGERASRSGGSGGGRYSSGLSLHIPPPSSCSSLPSPSKPASSPRSGVIVGISCTGGSSVVSHHHNIYVTSPVRPAPYSQRPRLDPPVSCAGNSSAFAPTTSYQGGSNTSSTAACGIDRATCCGSICPGSNNNTAGRTTPSPVHKESLQQKPVRRRTPPHFPPSQSNSSLESISEHGFLQGGVLSVLPPGGGDPFASLQHTNANDGFTSRNNNSGSTTTVLSPLDSTTTLRTGGGTLVTSGSNVEGRSSSSLVASGGGMVGSFQHGGSSGGTVLTPQSHRPGQLLGPPRLILPGPPADPPPD